MAGSLEQCKLLGNRVAGGLLHHHHHLVSLGLRRGGLALGGWDGGVEVAALDPVDAVAGSPVLAEIAAGGNVPVEVAPFGGVDRNSLIGPVVLTVNQKDDGGVAKLIGFLCHRSASAR